MQSESGKEQEKGAFAVQFQSLAMCSPHPAQLLTWIRIAARTQLGQCTRAGDKQGATARKQQVPSEIKTEVILKVTDASKTFRHRECSFSFQIMLRSPSWKICKYFWFGKRPLHPSVEMRILTWAHPYQINSSESSTAPQFCHAPATDVLLSPTSSFPHKPYGFLFTVFFSYSLFSLRLHLPTLLALCSWDNFEYSPHLVLPPPFTLSSKNFLEQNSTYSTTNLPLMWFITDVIVEIQAKAQNT